MKLFEVQVEGWYGESFTRFYVRTASEDDARRLSEREHRAKFPGATFNYELLYDEDDPRQFVTNPSDYGFDAGWHE